jgi:hypothetical protein
MSTEQNDSKRFSPFYGQGLYEIVPPLRKNKKRICRILAETEGGDIKQRVMYAKEAGIKITPNVENELANTYTEEVEMEELCLALFDLERDDIEDFELMNEGEVVRALNYFFMCRIGIY